MWPNIQDNIGHKFAGANLDGGLKKFRHVMINNLMLCVIISK